MEVVKVYSKNNCPACISAKTLLARKGITFEEINIDHDAQAKAFVLEQGHRSVPIFYAGGVSIKLERLLQLETPINEKETK